MPVGYCATLAESLSVPFVLSAARSAVYRRMGAARQLQPFVLSLSKHEQVQRASFNSNQHRRGLPDSKSLSFASPKRK
jgi:hypothetical protein